MPLLPWSPSVLPCSTLDGSCLQPHLKSSESRFGPHLPLCCGGTATTPTPPFVSHVSPLLFVLPALLLVLCPFSIRIAAAWCCALASTMVRTRRRAFFQSGRPDVASLARPVAAARFWPRPPVPRLPSLHSLKHVPSLEQWSSTEREMSLDI